MNRTRATVICLLIATLMASLPTFLLMEPPAASETFLNIVLGWFIAKGSDAIAYLLGSTANSATRNEAMVRATDAMVDQVKGGAGLLAPSPQSGTATITAAPDVDVSLRQADDLEIPEPTLGPGELPLSERVR